MRQLEADAVAAASCAVARRAVDVVRITAVAAAALILIGTVMLANRHAVGAHFADGTRGTFVVEDVFCQQRCTWTGFFYRDPQALGTWFTMAAGPGQTIRGTGHQVPAIDVGDPNQVYPLGVLTTSSGHSRPTASQ